MIANIFNNKDLPKKFFDDYNFFNNRKSTDKCLIIGSAPSISKIIAKDYVDNYDGYVIRINRPALPDYIGNYGTRCDTIFSFNGIEIQKDLEKLDYLKTFMRSGDISEIMKDIQITNPYMIWPTTGFVCIVLSMYLFNKIELLGFGETNVQQEDGHMNINIHNKKVNIVDHDFNVEHKMIDNWILSVFKDKIYRLEENFDKIQ